MGTQSVATMVKMSVAQHQRYARPTCAPRLAVRISAHLGRCGEPVWCSSDARSDADRPPHTPYSSPTARAWSRHCLTTGHRPQNLLACASRRARMWPRWSSLKKIDKSSPRHRARSCQSQKSAFGPGSWCGCGMQVLPFRMIVLPVCANHLPAREQRASDSPMGHGDRVLVVQRHHRVPRP